MPNTQQTPMPQPEVNLLPGVKDVIAVASGKGGVGKSTVTVNLAVSLKKSGARVGLLDADVYGPSIPLMFGKSETPGSAGPEKILPIDGDGIKIMSLGFFSDDTPLIWRGAMVSQAIQQLLTVVEWGELDYLLLDLPPGTGDAQLTLCQSAPISGAVIVTTPQDVSLSDARKGLETFRQLNVPILGLVENMSYFVCDECDDKVHFFGEGGGKKICKSLKLPFLGQIPIDPAVVVGGDSGKPIVSSDQNGPISRAFQSVMVKMVEELDRIGGAPRMFSLKKWKKLGADARFPDPPESSSADSGQPQQAVQVWQVSDSELGILWGDGQRSVYPNFNLRVKCPCAGCIDEWTGEARLDQAAIPKNVTIKSLESVGRYAIKIDWSDGHNTGIYSFNYLRGLTSVGRD